MGKKAYVKELIERAAEARADAIKFQLFPNIPKYTEAGNIWMSFDLFDEALEIGKQNEIYVSASVFGSVESDYLSGKKVPWIKIAHSMTGTSIMHGLIDIGKKLFVSSDINNRIENLPENVSQLYCIPEYPVRYVIDQSFFEYNYDGFSDHTLGIQQTINIAKHPKCRIIEKHVTLEYNDIICPDRKFAINFKQAKELRESLTSRE